MPIFSCCDICSNCCFPNKWEDSHLFSNGAPLGSWLSQEDLDEFQGHGPCYQAACWEDTSHGCSAAQERWHTIWEWAASKAQRERGLSMKVMQSQLNISTMTWFTLQASLLAFWEASKQDGKMNDHLLSGGPSHPHRPPGQHFESHP